MKKNLILTGMMFLMTTLIVSACAQSMAPTPTPLQPTLTPTPLQPTLTQTPFQPTLTPTPLQPTLTPTPLQPTLTPTPPSVVPDFMDNGVPMRLVPEGEFTMGSEDGMDDEKPVHQVYLDAFYMDKYEVTNALYKACVDAGACTMPWWPSAADKKRFWDGWLWLDDYDSDPQFDDYPVIFVDWYQAQSYCEWRGASLPTEAQWEKAARGTDGRTYPWGNTFDWHFANLADAPARVGSYESGQSPYGIYDMSGNVDEWTADWYSETYYQSSPSKNPLGSASPDLYETRVVRGGSWLSSPPEVRSSYRLGSVSTGFGTYTGFRCARSLP
ncbi:MAG: SUMF1/EgtB/PvdO family nonheme iron enzyme [Chloroflexota bacterium]